MRSERERRKIALESIAARTKISIGLLHDLERDRLSRWPGGIFRRAFVRSYAEAMGLDPDETLGAFLEEHGDAPELSLRAGGAGSQIEAAAPVARLTPAPRRTPRARPPLRLTLADMPRGFSGALLDASWCGGAVLPDRQHPDTWEYARRVSVCTLVEPRAEVAIARAVRQWWDVRPPRVVDLRAAGVGENLSGGAHAAPPLIYVLRNSNANQNLTIAPSFMKRPWIICVARPSVGPNVWISFSTTLEFVRL